MDPHQVVREQENPEIPSEKMVSKFDVWEQRYAIEKLQKLSKSDLESERLLFENEVELFIIEHSPGKAVANKPALAHLSGMNPYTSEEWRECRRLIREEAQDVRFRFKQARGMRSDKDETRYREFITDLVEAVFPERVVNKFELSLFRNR